jgi:nicotinate-nucleotide adenylyltransferase
MRVGLFGGTFDPVHNGHLRVAEEVRECFSLEWICFIPAYVQPLKGQSTAPADARERMLRLAIRGNRFFRTSTVELRRGGLSFSIDTVKTFSKRFDGIYFLIGMDAFMDMPLWKSYDELFSYANFVVMLRPGRKDESPPEGLSSRLRSVDESTWEHVSGKRIYFHRITQLDISSTKIRGLSRGGKSIRYLVPPAVERYIVKKGLYVG